MKGQVKWPLSSWSGHKDVFQVADQSDTFGCFKPLQYSLYQFNCPQGVLLKSMCSYPEARAFTVQYIMHMALLSKVTYSAFSLYVVCFKLQKNTDF